MPFANSSHFHNSFIPIQAVAHDHMNIIYISYAVPKVYSSYLLMSYHLLITMIYLNMYVHVSLGTVTVLYQTVVKDID